MYKKLFLIVAVVLGFVATAPPVNAATAMEEALKRMDAIISEMQALRSEFATLSLSTTVTPQAAVLGSVSSGVLGDDLRFGSTNDDIKKIQTLLATDPTIYPYGVASGYFGPKTQEAIRMFQSRFDLDTVGVVGPSTRALLEVFFAAYPASDYPDGVLLKKPKPTVQTSVTTQTNTVASTPVETAVLKSISVTDEGDEYIVRSYTKDGKRNRDLILYPEDKDELMQMIAKKLKVSESEVVRLVDDTDLEFGTKKSSSQNADKGDARSAISDADDALDDARNAIRDARDNGDSVADADDLYDAGRELYREAKRAYTDGEYDDAVDLSKEAQDLADEVDGEL